MAVDNRLEQFEMMQMEWIKYHAYVQMAPDMVKATEYLLKQEYLLVIIAGGSVTYMKYLK